MKLYVQKAKTSSLSCPICRQRFIETDVRKLFLEYNAPNIEVDIDNECGDDPEKLKTVNHKLSSKIQSLLKQIESYKQENTSLTEQFEAQLMNIKELKAKIVSQTSTNHSLKKKYKNLDLNHNKIVKERNKLVEDIRIVKDFDKIQKYYRDNQLIDLFYETKRLKDIQNIDHLKEIIKSQHLVNKKLRKDYKELMTENRNLNIIKRSKLYSKRTEKKSIEEKFNPFVNMKPNFINKDFDEKRERIREKENIENSFEIRKKPSSESNPFKRPRSLFGIGLGGNRSRMLSSMNQNLIKNDEQKCKFIRKGLDITGKEQQFRNPFKF